MLLTLAAAACGGDRLTLPNQGVAAKVDKIAGDGQSAPAGTAVAPPPSVKVSDATGSPVANVTVTFQVSGGGGSVSPASATTNATGVAAVTSWTLGDTPGANQLTATVTGSDITGNPAVFTATGVVGSGNKLAFLVQPSNTTVRQPISPPVQVQVRDAAGNPVTSATDPITVVLAANPGGSVLSGTTTVNAVNGVATFSNLSLDKGGTGYTLSALGSGLVGTTSSGFNVANRAPNASNDTYTTNEDTPLSVPANQGVLQNDSDPDGDPLTAVLVSAPQNAANFVLNPDGSFSYTPAANYNGLDPFTYVANDGSTNSATATVSITVNPVNDPPTFTLAGNHIDATAGTAPQSVPNWVTNVSPGPANESSQTVTLTVSNDNPAAFTPTGQPNVDAAGTLTYQPNLVVLTPTTATVTVTATDNGGTANGGSDTSTQQFTITVNPGP